MATCKMIAVWAFVSLPFLVAGDACLSPEVKSQTYTTTEAVASMETVLIAQFSLRCKNGLKDINLYADINGKTVPVTRTTEPFKYQVSLSDEHKKLPAGHYSVHLYDDEGYSALRKAHRSGENIDAVKPLYTIGIDHPGVWKGVMVQSEFVAAGVAIVLWYLAYRAKSSLQQTS
ncbi:hypothetical protein ScPMuIL_008823 [Solemya velum]